MTATPILPDYHLLRPNGVAIPFLLRNGDRLSRRQHATLFDALGDEPMDDAPTANLSKPARDYLAKLGVQDPDADARTAGLIWMHALAIGYSPAYLTENADGIRRDWPRIPLPMERKALEASAALGEQLAALLDTEAEVPGVTSGKIAAIFKTIGLVTKAGGGQIDPAGDDLTVTAGWGHKGKEGVTMPAKGKLAQRNYDEAEARAMAAEAAARGVPAEVVRRLLGEKTFDVYLNGTAFWRNIPLSAWEYYIGGYQVIKKWLSYREDGDPRASPQARRNPRGDQHGPPAGCDYPVAAHPRRELPVSEGSGLRLANQGRRAKRAALTRRRMLHCLDRLQRRSRGKVYRRRVGEGSIARSFSDSSKWI